MFVCCEILHKHVCFLGIIRCDFLTPFCIAFLSRRTCIHKSLYDAVERAMEIKKASSGNTAEQASLDRITLLFLRYPSLWPQNILFIKPRERAIKIIPIQYKNECFGIQRSDALLVQRCFLTNVVTGNSGILNIVRREECLEIR